MPKMAILAPPPSISYFLCHIIIMYLKITKLQSRYAYDSNSYFWNVLKYWQWRFKCFIFVSLRNKKYLWRQRITNQVGFFTNILTNYSKLSPWKDQKIPYKIQIDDFLGLFYTELVIFFRKTLKNVAIWNRCLQKSRNM